MITDGERRLIASECREMAYRSELTAIICGEDLNFDD